MSHGDGLEGHREPALLLGEELLYDLQEVLPGSLVFQEHGFGFGDLSTLEIHPLPLVEDQADILGPDRVYDQRKPVSPLGRRETIEHLAGKRVIPQYVNGHCQSPSSSHFSRCRLFLSTTFNLSRGSGLGVRRHLRGRLLRTPSLYTEVVVYRYFCDR